MFYLIDLVPGESHPPFQSNPSSPHCAEDGETNQSREFSLPFMVPWSSEVMLMTQREMQNERSQGCFPTHQSTLEMNWRLPDLKAARWGLETSEQTVPVIFSLNFTFQKLLTHLHVVRAAQDRCHAVHTPGWVSTLFLWLQMEKLRLCIRWCPQSVSVGMEKHSPSQITSSHPHSAQKRKQVRKKKPSTMWILVTWKPESQTIILMMTKMKYKWTSIWIWHGHSLLGNQFLLIPNHRQSHTEC